MVIYTIYFFWEMNVGYSETTWDLPITTLDSNMKSTLLQTAWTNAFDGISTAALLCCASLCMMGGMPPSRSGRNK